MEYQTDDQTTTPDALETPSLPPAPPVNLDVSSLDAVQRAELDMIRAQYYDLTYKIYRGEHQSGDIEERRELGCRMDTILAPIKTAHLKNAVNNNGIPVVTPSPNAKTITSEDVSRMREELELEELFK